MKDPTAAAAGRNLDHENKAILLTVLINGKHAFLDQTEATKLHNMLVYKRAVSGEIFAYVKGNR